MSEILPNPEGSSDKFEQKERQSMLEICSEYLTADDTEYFTGLDDDEDRIFYLYGRLNEEGLDPDEILAGYNVIEKGENDG